MRCWGMLLGVLLVAGLVGCRNTGELGGTNWSVIEVMSLERPDITDLDVEFGTDGWLSTTLTMSDGSVELGRRPYHVYKSLLVVERPEGDLELLHLFKGEYLFLADESFQARFLRMN